MRGRVLGTSSLLVLAIFGAATGATPATAQSGESEAVAQHADELSTQDIVITARYRSESLQDTPIAITALTGAQLESRGFNNVLDVAQSAPNVTLSQAAPQGGKSAVAIIRGVGQTDFSFALEPGVGFYLDDVYQATAFGSIFELADTERVEILRGPQGTLFGKNNEGGAIRVYSARPKGDDSGYVELSYGNYNRFQGKAAFDLSLTPELALRVSGAYLHTDGFQDRIDYACANPGTAGNLPALTLAKGCKLGTLGGQDVRAARASLRWQPTSDLEINIIGDVLDDDGQPQASSLLIVDPTVPGALLQAYNDQYVVPKLGIPIDSRFISSDLRKTYAPFNDPITGLSEDPRSTVTTWGVTGIINWNLGSSIRLKSVTGYRKSDGEAVLFQPVPIPPAPAINIFGHHQFSQEIDVSGTVPLLGGNLDWTVGGYYFDGTSTNTGLIALPGFAPAFGFFYAFQPDDPANDTNKSGFVHAVYNLTDALSIEGGVRYSVEDKDYTFSRLLVPQNVLQYPVTTVASSNERVDYKLGVQYKIRSRAMVYASFSTGYKAGGFNPRPLGPEQITAFDPEELTAYELGAKVELFDRRLRANLAVFQSDYKNLQIQALTFDNTGAPAYLYTNVGKARIRGVELETDLEPVDGLTMNASVGYLDYETLDLGAAEGVPNGPLKDASPPLTPKWKVNIGAQYRADLGNAGTLTPRIDFVYQSRVYNDQRGTMDVSQAGYSLVNARLTYALPDNKWQVSLQVSNLTDKSYFTWITDSRTGTGMVDGQIGRPREFWASVRREF